MLAAVLAMSMNAFCAKMLFRVETFQILFIRSLFIFLIVGGVLSKRTTKVQRKNKQFLYWQSIIGFISSACFIYGIKYLPLSEAISIMYNYPIFTSIFSWILVNKTFSKVSYLFVLISFAGVVMIVRPHKFFSNEGKELNSIG